MRFKQLISKRLEDSVAVKSEILSDTKTLELISEIANLVIKAIQDGRKVILFGNGGSAADAQHIAAELMGKYYLERRSLPAIALTINTSNLTALSNDYHFSEVFKKQLQGIGKAGDVAIGISTSGNSENVINALQTAKDMDLLTVGFTGNDGGKLKDTVDYCICVPSNDTPRIQEAHITIGHIICEIVEKELFGKDKK